MATASGSTKKDDEEAGDQSRGECFVIMPISDPEGYADGHFKRVYEDIFKPAIRRAGYEPRRADEVEAANVIHVDLLRRLLNAPMALCDLSTRNPNVLFELGLRQAFDKPVVVVQEHGTLRIFDVGLIRAVDYRQGRLYHEVLEDQLLIANAIEATRVEADDPTSVNSLVRLLGLSEPATAKDRAAAESDPGYRLLREELAQLRRDILETGATGRPVLKLGAAGHVSAPRASAANPNAPLETLFGGCFLALEPVPEVVAPFVEAFTTFSGRLARWSATSSAHPLRESHPVFMTLDLPVAGRAFALGLLNASRAVGMGAPVEYALHQMSAG